MEPEWFSSRFIRDTEQRVSTNGVAACVPPRSACCSLNRRENRAAFASDKFLRAKRQPRWRSLGSARTIRHSGFGYSFVIRH